jgi:prolyl oligopeptidase
VGRCAGTGGGCLIAAPLAEARPEPVEFGGGAVRYVDPFRWLEEDAAGDVAAWQQAQHDAAGAHLTGLPRYDRFLAALRAMGTSGDMILPVFAGGQYVLKFVPDGEDLMVVELSDTPTGPGRRVVDLNALRTDEALQLGAFTLSHSGKLAIFAYAAGGREKPIVQLIEVETGRILSQGLPNERMTTFTWLPDDSGFFYMSSDTADIAAGKTLYRVSIDRPGEAVLEDVAPSHPYARPVVAADDRHILLFANHLAPRPEYIFDTQGAGTWQPFLKDVPGIFRGDIVGDHFFAITDDVASRGRMVAIPLATPTRKDTWREIVAPSEDFLANVVAVGERAVLLDYVDTYSRLRVYDRHGVLEGEIALPGKGLVNRVASFYSFFNITNSMVRGAGDTIDFLFATPCTAFAYYSADVATRALTQVTAPDRTLDAKVLDCKAISADGAEVVYHVLARHDLDLSKPHPTVITGYGGYNVAVLPGWFGNQWAAWVEAGGILVLSHLRGGGEFGSDWWMQGRLEHKQNTFNDVYATAEDLIARGITTPAQLGVTGGSNGGVMAAACAVQRPDLFRASAPAVPITDLLARIRDPFCMAASQDYGDPSDPAMARILQAWSPYQNVQDGTAYPAMLIDSGANDPRCPPWHGRKLAARMQQANGDPLPILLRVRADAGHGAIGHDDQMRQSAELLAFFAEYLGLDRDPALGR